MLLNMYTRARRCVVCGVAVLTLACTAATRADIIYVDDDATAGGDGTSWSTAFNDLQLALAIVQEGDEIRVAQGIYKPCAAQRAAHRDVQPSQRHNPARRICRPWRE